MEHILLVVHVFIAAGLIGLVLLQRSESDGFGLGSGSGSNFMSGRATANLLTRATAIMATLFIVNSLLLSVLAARGRAPSIVQTIEEQQKSPAAANAVPAVPLAGEEKKSIAPDAKPAAPNVTDKKNPANAKNSGAAPVTAEETLMPAELPPKARKPAKKALKPSADAGSDESTSDTANDQNQ